ncbi:MULTISPECIES: hypothetical protein [unclassified Streptomyces]|uniref:hypothetical protein n=1 Tax=unclassified Streptomyces TaxID=2593676 RepID=UPI00224F6DC9|nr:MULTISPECIES: hypothetical protein [unclassified Streptomyces]MCX5047595.1 hypothetical protein [Streptomyces sp. NBC_00474]MCX5057716.1 hypothetical protein [Streptomyces sp. NBC_00452]MCX5245406.1 hypothetical protein [Streptomyces sp. NBC_00201]
MAGRRRASRSALVVLVLLLVSLVACGGRPVGDTAKADLQRVLDRRSTAVLDRDRGAFLTTGELGWFENLRGVPLAAWSYRVTALHRTGDEATAAAELRYRIEGYDKAPVTVGRTLTLSRETDGQWYVDADKPAKKAAQQLWDQGGVTVVRGRHSLVLGTGQSSEALHTYADLADKAVPAVSGAWGLEWTGQVVVLVPGSVEGMAGLLGSPASQYRGIAAVTTGEVGGPPNAPADRIIVNPDAYALLGPLGKQVVLTHETTHVATRAHTTAATPLWLSEGYADWIGYLGTTRTPSEAAPELARAVNEGRVPDNLPTDRDFGFSGDATKLAQSYEAGWMACRMIAGQWGQERLGRFYRAVGDHQQRSGSVENALKKVLGTTPEKFTAQWRDYLQAQLG